MKVRPMNRSLTDRAAAICAAVVLTLVSPVTLAARSSTVIDAPVVASEPIVEVITERIPRELCREERVRVVERGGGHSATPALIGAVVGGAAGAVLGDNSSNKDVIAGAGAVLGASIGHDAGHRRKEHSYYVTEEVCEVEYELREREQVNGYRVRYRFGDTIYETRRATAPGSTIAVRVQLEPLP